MFEFLFSSNGFMPHGHCYLWRPDLLWLHVGADTLIALSYYTIPAFILVFAMRRPELRFRSLYWLFGLFIFLCGTTHLLSVVTTFKPFYLAEGMLKVATGIASAATAVVLWKLLPKALKVPTIQELDESNKKLADLNSSLEEHVREKTQKLVEADKAKDQFLAMVSHELRSPLAIVAGYFELLEMSENEPEERQFALKNININLAKQQMLLNNLVDVSRIISGNFPFDKHDVDLNKVICDTLDSLELKAHQKNITLSRKIQPDLGRVYCDDMRISQVITNLTENAIKFSPEHSVIEVACHRDSQETVIVTVRDHGTGINTNQLPFIFERYWQSGETKFQPTNGLGLGLAISKHIVEGHHGQITAASPGPGSGAEFTFTLPQLRSQLAESAAPPLDNRIRPVSMVTGVKILIVDDNYDVLQLLGRLTAKLGMKPYTASNVKSALEMLTSDKIDLILSDIGMPTTDGLDFIEAVRRAERYSGQERCPAIAISADVSEKQRSVALESGFDAFLTKPVSANQLLDTIGGLLC